MYCRANWGNGLLHLWNIIIVRFHIFLSLVIQISIYFMFEIAILLSWFFRHFFPVPYFFAFINCWYCCIYFPECRHLFYLLFIDYIIYSGLAIKPLILAIHYIFRSLLKVVTVEKCMCMCMQSLLLILFIYLSAIEKIMEKNNENTQNNDSKFREWLQVKSKTNIILKETYHTIVAYLKILNQETDEHDFPEKIKKRIQRNQYELMNYALLNLKDILCVPSKDKRELGLYKSFIWKVIATVVVCIDKYQVMHFMFIYYIITTTKHILLADKHCFF